MDTGSEDLDKCWLEISFSLVGREDWEAAEDSFSTSADIKGCHAIIIVNIVSYKIPERRLVRN